MTSFLSAPGRAEKLLRLRRSKQKAGGDGRVRFEQEADMGRKKAA